MEHLADRMMIQQIMHYSTLHQTAPREPGWTRMRHNRDEYRRGHRKTSGHLHRHLRAFLYMPCIVYPYRHLDLEETRFCGALRKVPLR
jgi:hypothetical protein